MPRRRTFRTLAARALPLSASLALLGCGASDALVGGECASGYTQCGTSCVDTAHDQNNCGMCGYVCGGGTSCAAGNCGPPVDGGGPDGASDASSDSSVDSTVSDGATDALVDGQEGPGRDAHYPGDPDGGLDGTPDGLLGDAGTDATLSDSGSDSGFDSGFDAGTDATLPDSGSDSGFDSGFDAGSDGGFDGGTDATVADSGFDSGFDGGLDSGFDGGFDSGFDACTPPYNTVSQCGSCGNACVDPSPVCRQVDDAGTFACQTLCDVDAGQSNCGGTCVTVASDKSNCGACGHLCPSGFCSTSTCLGKVQGSVVYIGDDYEGASTGTSEFQLLVNAISLLPNTTPIKVLEYTAYADGTVVSNVETGISHSPGGGNVSFTHVGAATDVTAGLYDGISGALLYSVLLVYDQRDGDTATLATLGSSWAPALSQFTNLGGVVIFLDGDGARGDGSVGSMPILATATGLLTVTSHAIVPANTPVTVAGGDTVGNHVVSPFAAGQDTVSIVTEAAGVNVTYVAVDNSDGGTGNPVVVHKVFN